MKTKLLMIALGLTLGLTSCKKEKIKKNEPVENVVTKKTINLSVYCTYQMSYKTDGFITNDPSKTNNAEFIVELDKGESIEVWNQNPGLVGPGGSNYSLFNVSVRNTENNEVIEFKEEYGKQYYKYRYTNDK